MDVSPPQPPPAPSMEWESVTHRFVVDRHEGYIIVASADGRPVHLDIRVAKAGGVLRGLLDSLATSVRLGLDHGVPMAEYVAALSHVRFEPAGWTKELGYASSIVDYVFRWLQRRYPLADASDPGKPGQPLAIRDGPTCATCGSPVTWGPGSPCPECGEIAPPAAPPPEPLGNRPQSR